MAEKCDGQLKGMVQDLREIIDYLNASNANQQQEENPVSTLYVPSVQQALYYYLTNILFSKVMQIAKILNVHMDSLHWIDQNSGRN